MTAYVDECRHEWRRLGVPDLLAEEMATELESDLAEAEADGVSAAEMLGESDPRRFAATWASERGLVAEPAPRKTRRWIWAAGFVLALVFVVVLGLFAAAKVSVQSTVAAPPPRTVAIAAVPNFVGMKRSRALSLARRIGLDPEIRVVSGRGRPAGVVVAQAPAPAARLRRGSTVLLRVGRG